VPSKALTKSALLLEIAAETDTDRKTAAFFLEVITDIALREVKKNGEFTFPGIGNRVKQRNAWGRVSIVYIRNCFATVVECRGHFVLRSRAAGLL
jgi:hypothetical protein